MWDEADRREVRRERAEVLAPQRARAKELIKPIIDEANKLRGDNEHLQKLRDKLKNFHFPTVWGLELL